MSKILIMGGTVFISSSLAKHLISQNHIVDILTRGTKEPDYTGYRNHLKCNRKNPSELKETLQDKEYDYIFDISAYTKEDVEILLTTIKPKKKFIFISSGAVYAPSPSLISEDYTIIDNPIWGQYGLDKAEAENYIFSQNISHAIFRPAYIYGETNNLYRESFFFDRLLEHKEIFIPKIQETTTQFIHIDDVVRAMESAMYIDNPQGVYNLSYPEQVTWDILVDTCSKVAKETPIKTYITDETIDARSYFPFRDFTYMLDIGKLIADGLYIPKLSLEEGLRQTFEWYKKEQPKLSDKRMTLI
ncbi:MAG: NAD-dependent epimerase/dehydratase family protein [Clostridium sp.]